jgi:6-phosphogluconolactonase (cycloisomerase 2 family)
MQTPATEKDLTFVGCYTTAARKARGTGIDAYRSDPRTRAWQRLDHVGDVVNPSFMISDPVRNTLYVAHGDLEYASAYQVDPSTGRLRFLGQAAAGGRNGVSIALDPTRQFLVVANYSSGSVAALPIGPDGALGDFAHCLELPGACGPYRTEQAMSHPHHTVFDPSGRFLLVPDKGLDRIHVLALDAATGRLAVASQAAMRAGAGPRHIAFHPTLPRAFVVNELDSTIATCGWDAEAGVLTPLHLVPGLPPTFFGVSTAAEVVVTPCGRFVYASHRGQDVVTHCRFDAANDRLDVVGWTPTEGRDPRFMTLTPKGDCLLVANEQGDSIVAFAIDAASGSLAAQRTMPSASPSTIAFL